MMSSISAMSSGGSPSASARPRNPFGLPESEPHAGARINLLLKSSYAAWVECIGRALHPHGLTHSAYVTLLAMHSRPHWVANPSLLAGVIAETRTNTTRICDRLTRQGLIRRVGSTSDRRRVDLTLTEAGEALVAAVVPQIDRLLDETFAIFSADERATLERMLERLNDGLTTSRGRASRRSPD
jgi:MarR family transcriptional repressor of emrRAB